MLCLKNFRCTCVLALIIFSSLNSQAQDEICHLTRLHIEPGQERAFIMANSFFTKNRPARTAAPWTTYVYSDHTIRITVPADDLPYSERQEGNRYFTTNFIPISDLIDGEIELCDPRVRTGPITSREEQVMRYRADLSYAPATTARPSRKTEPLPYVETTTYRAKTGHQDKVLEMSRQLVALLKEIDSPLAFQFYSCNPEGKINEFEIAFPAYDADDLAARRAGHNANLSEALKQWQIEIPLYVEKVRTITGRYVYEMSDAVKPASLSLRR